MDKLAAVIRREFVERVRTRAFIVSTVMGPVLMAIMVFLPIILSRRETAPKYVVVVDGASGSFGWRVAGTLSAARFGRGVNAAPRYFVERVPAQGRVDEVRDSLIALVGVQGPGLAPDGLLVLTDQVLDSGQVTYLGANVGSPTEMESLEASIQQVILSERLIRERVNPRTVELASAKVRLETARITNGKLTGESGEASFFLTYIMAFLLYLALLLYGIQVMSSVLEEKTNRIVEILASSLTPFELMLGKVIGVGLVGLFQLTIWAAAGVFLTGYLAPILGGFGPTATPDAGPPIPQVSLPLLAVFLLFFVLGFFLYAACYAAIGAMCKSHQETQQANMPVTLLVVLGFMSVFPLLNEPNGSLARVLSLIPFFAPFATPLRYSISPIPVPELIASIAATSLGVAAVVWVAARIYRVGILAYGKRPTMRELARWVRG